MSQVSLKNLEKEDNHLKATLDLNQSLPTIQNQFLPDTISPKVFNKEKAQNFSHKPIPI